MAGTIGTAAGAAGSRILGVGAYRPGRVVPNDELVELIDSSDEWIRRHSGIVSRRFGDAEETVVGMAVAASLKALAQAGVAAEEVDMVLLATMSHLEQSPAAAPQIAHLTGASSAGAMDVSAACAGFVHALAVADALIRTGAARRVLVVGSEKMTDIIDLRDRATAFLFGDGAGAVVVGPADTPGIGPVVWGSDGGHREAIAHSGSWLELRDGQAAWPTLRMNGPSVYRWAIGTVPQVCRRALAAAGTDPAELGAFIPHQANLRIVDAAVAALGLPPHVAVSRDVTDTGNTSAASIPLAMERMVAQGRAGSGDLALLVGFGAGLTHAAMVVALP
ncbi:putative 3-oxoacyl-ACP synthase [Actinacidiphila reveromycinica]|uniref:Beta-ketoacyl-[acyl-carrier-protein] synthase III n=1 Tax=Actinacidiphila reveromycinica TaxID=659352 RepID=G1UDT8_9ACTN|nr:beta-ketoacyl-ACP synthase III [Streptomyces sp. SN-593]BAK64634.1 putative 3-oxoacyl-ACP synthase [Streptomyces sp. SN-593]BBB01291.1 putative 3-oxoacyl-ACP synthase [Streptomyces sp. SN-593]